MVCTVCRIGGHASAEVFVMLQSTARTGHVHATRRISSRRQLDNRRCSGHHAADAESKRTQLE